MSLLKQSNISRAYSLFSKQFLACASTCQVSVKPSLTLLNTNCAGENPDKCHINSSYFMIQNSAITDKRFTQISPQALSVEEMLATPSDHYENVLCQVTNQIDSNATDQSALEPAHDADLLDCQVFGCPDHLKSEWSSLFQDWDMSRKDLTIIALSHRTECNIFDWNEKMAEERELLADSFVEAAITICETLKDLGFRADFINPHTGTPYLSAPTENTLSETDDRLRSLGFTVDDLICCKVLRHNRWGNQFAVGILLTDAPKSHPLLTSF